MAHLGELHLVYRFHYSPPDIIELSCKALIKLCTFKVSNSFFRYHPLDLIWVYVVGFLENTKEIVAITRNI